MALAYTPGEPAGIGPDLIIKLVQGHQFDLVAIADPDLLQQRAKQLGLPLQIYPADAAMPPKQGIRVAPVALHKPVTAGELDSENSEYVLETLRQGVNGCLNNTYSALVTGPVHKGVINRAGIDFTGHTEFLAKRSGVEKVVMMLSTAYPTKENPQHELRVPLATTHLPLTDVSAAITPHSLIQIISIIDHTLRHQYRIENPHILVCGLNPHAGEGGYLGMEEIKVITPVLLSLKEAGLNLSGPVPADTAFTPSMISKADAILAMYHDQGLPTLKHLGFGNAVNITLGLPFVRTSVDHGTALDLAGTGKANIESLIAAIRSAIRMTTQSNH